MVALSGVPLLLAAAAAIAEKLLARVGEIHALLEQDGRTSLVNGLRVSTTENEVAAVGIFSLFEARMQGHFPPGPFLAPLEARLDADGRTDLKDRFTQFYLAVNVLKHGDGQSYRRLQAIQNLPFAVKPPGDVFFNEGDVAEPEGLIDTSGGFFAGLLTILEDTYDHLGPP